MNTVSIYTEPQVIYRQVLANLRRAKAWQLGLTFPARFNAALPIHHMYTLYAWAGTRVSSRGTKQIRTTGWLEINKQMHNLKFHLYFSLNCS